MIQSNIRFLGRMELIYTCISKLVVYLTKKQPDIIPGQLKHYADPNDYNRLFYHQRNDDMEAIIQRLLTDSGCLLHLCGTDFENVTDYQYDKNTHTDSQFLQETLSAMEKSEEEIILVTDGGYDGQDNIALAKEKNVRLVTTALIGKEAPDALADFEFNGDGTRLLKCAAGHVPISQSYTKSTRQCRVSFDRNHCAGCPYQEQKVITDLYNKNDYLLQGKLLNEKEQKYYQEIEPGMSSKLAADAINTMAGFMQRYYGQKVIIILDEYDTPMQDMGNRKQK